MVKKQKQTPEERIAELERIISEKDARIADLDDVNRRLLRRLFGARNERRLVIDDAQCKLELEQQLEEPQAKEPNESQEKTVAVPAHRRKRQPQQRRQLWSRLLPDVPVDEELIELEPQDQFDVDGHPLVAMGTETREELVVEPGTPRIRRIIRQRYGRSDTSEKIAIAPNPDRIVPRGGLSDETIVSCVVQHGADCLPFHRIAEGFARQKLPINRQMVTRSCLAWAELAAPMLNAMQRQIHNASVIHIDGSFVQHHNRVTPRKTARRPIYAISDGDQVVMRWRKDERHATAADLIAGYQGYVVRDEHHMWYKLNNQAAITHVACNAHARRPFAERQRDSKDARKMVDLYARIYRAERRILARGYDPEERYRQLERIRQRYTKHIMKEIADFATYLRDRKTGALKRAANYILNHKYRLELFLTDGRLPPDNNLAERALRQNALLRKNRLFYVSQDGGTHIGTILSIVGSCKLLGINPYRYLMDCRQALFAYRRAADDAKPDLSDWTPLSYKRRMDQLAQSLAAA